ncbi:MAG: SGNH/GDSL hydrolase family protein [Desulfovibrionaceae bacterium]|nr:SGNH/GDSL hydrolase family protein [Desulfovibrionaceae bacterium]MBF0512753.1 SGNH/GDSL hydrolase family protein [Desulfovibrionaceae bacterium]
MKRLFFVAWSILKWCLIAVAAAEILSFGVIIASNYLIYGEAREGTRSTYDAYALYLMSEGVRATANNPADPGQNKTKSIWFFGGSTMRASATTVSGTIPSMLAGWLNAEDAHVGYYLDNYGINSYNSLMESKYLQKLLIERPDSPNLVIFYDGANDASYLSVYRTPYAHEGYDKVKGMIESYYKNAVGLFKPVMAAWYSSYTRELINKFNYLSTPLEVDSAMVNEYVGLTVKRYDYLNKLVSSFGSKFILFLQPLNWTEQCPHLDPVVAALEKKAMFDEKRFPTTRHNFRVVYTALKLALKDRPYFVDMQDALCGRTAASYTPDGVHNTDYARDIIARAMLPYIKERLAENR